MVSEANAVSNVRFESDGHCTWRQRHQHVLAFKSQRGPKHLSKGVGALDTLPGAGNKRPNHGTLCLHIYLPSGHVIKGPRVPFALPPAQSCRCYQLVALRFRRASVLHAWKVHAVC
eukprot:5822728-Amphidinium_carterae.1